MLFKKIGLFFEKYWKIIALIVGSIVGLFLIRGKTTNFSKDYLEIKRINDEKTKKIADARAKEVELKAKNKADHDKKVEIINKESDKKLAAFEENKKQKAQDLVNNTKGDVNKLADETSKALGFKVILPKDDDV